MTFPITSDCQAGFGKPGRFVTIGSDATAGCVPDAKIILLPTAGAVHIRRCIPDWRLISTLSKNGKRRLLVQYGYNHFGRTQLSIFIVRLRRRPTNDSAA